MIISPLLILLQVSFAARLIMFRSAMEFSSLTTEVLRLLLAQNSLPITGSREQLIDRLATIDPSTGDPNVATRTRGSGATPHDDPAAKRPRTSCDPSSGEGSSSEENPPRTQETIVVADGSSDQPNEANRTDAIRSEIQDGRQSGGVPADATSNPAALAALISSIVEDKLQTFRPPSSSLPAAPLPLQQQPPLVPLQPPPSQQPSLQHQLGNPHFVASLLSQPVSQPSALTQPPSQASLTSHVQPKTRQAILRGEYVEFDSLLPENSCLDEGNHPGVSISFDGKQLNIPSPSRKRKTDIDSIDKWLSAFAVYCMIFLAQFPQRAVEMFSYQEIIRSAHRKFSRFSWLSYNIDFHRKAASNPALNWGERDIQLYLLKFTGQAKSSCSICGSGDHFGYGCSLSALRPNSTASRGTCNNYNRGARCSQDPCPYSHRCKTCNGDHPSYRHDDPSPKSKGHGDKKSSSC